MSMKRPRNSANRDGVRYWYGWIEAECLYLRETAETEIEQQQKVVGSQKNTLSITWNEVQTESLYITCYKILV